CCRSACAPVAGPVGGGPAPLAAVYAGGGGGRLAWRLLTFLADRAPGRPGCCLPLRFRSSFPGPLSWRAAAPAWPLPLPWCDHWRVQRGAARGPPPGGSERLRSHSATTRAGTGGRPAEAAGGGAAEAGRPAGRG